MNDMKLKKNRKGDAWAKQKGRSPKPSEKEMEALGLGIERLILSPDDEHVKRNRSKGSVSMGSTTGRGGAAGSSSLPGGGGVDGGMSYYADGDIVKVDVHEYEDKRKRRVGGGVKMNVTTTVPRKALGKPPRPPRNDKKSRTLAGAKRVKKSMKKKMTPAQRLLHVARQQHLQTEEALFQDALDAWPDWE